ncbi:Fic family protein [Rhodococcus sp. HM1]|uniref:Fic/DOC family protein n=1 Tax=Rhodococcus sp. HM1 TaxID=2937759 RepID=UPI00200A8E15|nr:Fic family protein [Rhodococcus sp. HM1]MCK8673960.1 Fic family protein [Rhodococcus sp. HM1]
MTTASSSLEGYIPGTDTRVNLLGITDAQELAAVEKRLFAEAMWQFAGIPTPDTFTGEFLREIHHRGFDGLYSWAGQYKTVPTTQGNLPITHSSPEDTAADVEELFADLAAENNLIGLDHHTFVTRLADYWARMTEIHPFPDGNSRSQYELFRRIADNAGWQIDTARVDLAALSAARYITAETGDPRLLADVLAPAVVPNAGYVPERPAPGRPVLSLVSHLAMMRDYDRDRSGPYTAGETFRQVPRERVLRGAELDSAHALVRLGLALAERADYGPEHDAAVRRILEGTSTLAAERTAAALPAPNDRYKDLFDPTADKRTISYDTGAPVNAFDERDPARLRRLITWELALRTADYLAHREVTGDGSELHASVIHRELHTDFMPIISDTPAYTSPVIAGPLAHTLADPHRLGRHIAAIQEETEGVQSVAVLLMADQLAHSSPDRAIDWRVIDPEALRAANHAANYHDDPPEDAEADLPLEAAIRTAGREAFAAELERAFTTELPSTPTGLGTADASQRYDRHWDVLTYRSYALLENSPDRNEIYEPLTTPTLAPEEPIEVEHDEELSLELAHEKFQRDTTSVIDQMNADRWAEPTADIDAPEPEKQTHIDHEPQNELSPETEAGKQLSQHPTAEETHKPPQVHHTPPQPNGRPPATHDHQPPIHGPHLGPEL